MIDSQAVKQGLEYINGVIADDGARGVMPERGADVPARARGRAARRPCVALAALGFAIAALLARPAAGVTALEYTRDVLERARTIVAAGDLSHDQKLVALDSLLGDFLDTDAIGRAALAEHWAELAPAQQGEFLALFRRLLQRSYVQKLLLFDRPTFDYVGEVADGGATLVSTRIVTPGDAFLVRYRMRADGRLWLATDIQIEDMSLTDNLRRLLDHQLVRGSVPALLETLRRKYGAGPDQR